MKSIKNDLSICDGKECHILFYFTANWCGPCKKIKPLIEAISDGADEKKLEVYMVDIDENEEFVNKLKVKNVPNFYLFHKNELKGNCSGADINKVKDLLSKI
jgi:thiol-disulfide isomerase/thioredoxin